MLHAGWTTTIPVLAYVVTIKDAAKPDKEGLLQPLLRRWQAGGCSYSVFSLPAVQASGLEAFGPSGIRDTLSYCESVSPTCYVAYCCEC
jgi:hypothetical protein